MLAASARAGVRRVWRLLPAGIRHKRRPLRAVNLIALAAGADPLVLTRTRSGHRLLLDLRSGSEWFAHYSGEFDDQRIAAARRLLPRADGIVVDAGANIGFWTVPLAGDLAFTVVACSPSSRYPPTRPRLRRNLALNGLERTVDIREVALSDRHGHTSLSLREDFRDGAATGNAAVVIDDGADRSFDQLTVPTVPLDDLVAELGYPSVDFIKADLEGHEDRFLAGALGVLRDHRCVVVIEWNRIYYQRRRVDPTAALARVLDGLDYVCLRHDGGTWSTSERFFSPRPLDDLILAPRERVASVLAELTAW